MQEGFARFLADFLQRFQAVAGESGADHVHAFGAAACQLDQRRLGVGLQPFGLAKARLEGHQVLRGRQAQALGQQACGLARFAVVGVAQVQRALGHAVKAHDQFLATAVAAPVGLDALGQRVDVGGIVVVAVDEAQLGNMALGAGPVIDGVEHAGRGRARVLRVQRQDEDARGALGLEGIEHAGDGGVSIAHGMAHQHVVPGLAQPAAQQQGLARAPVLQGGAVLLMPDGGVLGRRLGRPRAQDDAVQDGQPGNPGDLDHAVVAQELRQVAAHGRGRWRIGRSKVAQQHGGALGLIVAEWGFWREAGRHGADCGRTEPPAMRVG